MRRGGVGVLEKRDIWKTVGRGRGAGELNGRMIFFFGRVPEFQISFSSLTERMRQD